MKRAKLLLTLMDAGLNVQAAAVDTAGIDAVVSTAEIERIQVSSIRAAYPVRKPNFGQPLIHFGRYTHLLPSLFVSIHQ